MYSFNGTVYRKGNTLGKDIDQREPIQEGILYKFSSYQVQMQTINSIVRSWDGSFIWGVIESWVGVDNREASEMLEIVCFLSWVVVIWMFAL